MTEQEYLEYLEDGKKIINVIGDDLNTISDLFIRLDGVYRKERDFKEICVALGLLANITDLNIDSLQ